MSRAVELAKRFVYGKKFGLDGRVTEYSFFPDNLESFYHAARAEALREAADKMDEEIHDVTDPVRWLRAMADREGK